MSWKFVYKKPTKKQLEEREKLKLACHILFIVFLLPIITYLAVIHDKPLTYIVLGALIVNCANDILYMVGKKKR